jgi:hypothetical protein
MDHAYVEEHQVVDRYLAGELAPEDLGRFEEHYLSCAACLDLLETTEDLARALKRVAAEDAARIAAGRQLAAVAWLARLGRSRQAAILISGLLLVLLVPGLALVRTGELGRRLRETRSSLAAAGAKEQADLAAGRRDLAREREERARVDQELAQARRPQTNVPILLLGAERGAGQAAGPTYRLRLPAKPGWVVFSLPVEPPHPAAYRIVLSRAGGGEIWRGEASAAPDQDTLTLGIPSRLLAPGDHVLAVSGAAPGDGRGGAAAARFAFRVLPPA